MKVLVYFQPSPVYFVPKKSLELSPATDYQPHQCSLTCTWHSTNHILVFVVPVQVCLPVQLVVNPNFLFDVLIVLLVLQVALWRLLILVADVLHDQTKGDQFHVGGLPCRLHGNHPEQRI